MPRVLQRTKSTKLQISLCFLRQWANPKCYGAFALEGAEKRTVKQRLATRSSEPGWNAVGITLSSLPPADFSQAAWWESPRRSCVALQQGDNSLGGAAGLLTLRRHRDDRFGGGVVVIVFQRAIAAVVALDVILINQFL